MTPEAKQRLREALHAAQLIERATRTQTLDGYLGDEWFQSAAERQLEIIGEAFNQASRLDPDVANHIPDFRGWIGLRNVLAHAYYDLKANIIWQTMDEEIPELIVALENSLSSLGRPEQAGNEDSST